MPVESLRRCLLADPDQPDGVADALMINGAVRSTVSQYGTPAARAAFIAFAYHSSSARKRAARA